MSVDVSVSADVSVDVSVPAGMRMLQLAGVDVAEDVLSVIIVVNGAGLYV